LGPWRANPGVAQITVAASLPAPVAVVDRCLDQLRDLGYSAVVTSALLPSDSEPFLALGFDVREQLHLLEHALSGLPVPSVRTRRARGADRPDVLRIDHLGFDQFWRFDDRGLDDALGATPSNRFRVITGDAGITAYAITGRAGDQGYLQRLAVDPAARRSGHGSALVYDGLRWLRRHGAERALVNTQMRNVGAVELYERCGFRRLATPLSVLGRAL
jgi:ribosomal-protein-alanine N-acetyltransferase